MTGMGPVVVTGGSGFVGHHLLDALAAEHRGPLIAWGRSRTGTRADVRWRQVDVLDREAVGRAIADDRPAALVHLAGAPHVGHSWQNALPTLQINVLGTHHLLEALRTHAPQCRTIVVTSGMIYKPGPDALTEDAPLVPTNPYGLSKLAQDELARLAVTTDGLNVVVARPFNHIGPGQDASFALSSFARQIARIEQGEARPEIHVGNLDAQRDLTDVRDVVAAYLRLLDDAVQGSAYNVCSGRVSRIGDLLDTLLGMTAAHVEVVPDPERLRPADIPHLRGSHERLSRDLGWQPSIPITRTLSDTLDWWRQAPSRSDKG